MVDMHASLSINRQCKILCISRSSYYYKSIPESALNLEWMNIIDGLYLKYPFYGSRKMYYHLRQRGHMISRKRVQRLMRQMGIMAIYQKPSLSKPNVGHKIYPYLLRQLNIDHSNQVWCSDITYIPTKYGFMYLVAVADWYSRKILSWRLSNTLDTQFCLEALQEALDIYGSPEIFNTDQGSQFTSQDFTEALKAANIKISMDGKGRWIDNVFIERIWRSLKYECIYLCEFETVRQAKQGIENYFDFYNTIRPHETFGGQTPDYIYTQGQSVKRTQQLAA